MTGGILIVWVAPNDGSDTISEYLIEIGRTGAANYIEDAVNCGGSDPSVVQCLIPMGTLTSNPYDLIFNELVTAQVTAINAYGPSPPSVVNSDGARIR